MVKSAKSPKSGRKVEEDPQPEVDDESDDHESDDHDDDEEDVDDNEDVDDESDGNDGENDDDVEDENLDGPHHDDSDNDENDDKNATKKKRKVHKLSLSQTRDFNETLRKRGVVYMSRVPPRMNPAKVKHLLGGFGCDVTRVYLVEEDAALRKRRRKVGKGGAAKRYVEGWIEFEKKKVAKHVAASLNNTEISNQKRNVHYGDLWNLKYLNKFKWEHLTERVAYERRVREQKLRVELFHARRENAAYAQLVETGAKLDKIEARKRKRGETDGVESAHQRRKGPRQTKPVDSADKAAKGALLKSLV
jgi:ESF2/ABP1 family protein